MRISEDLAVTIEFEPRDLWVGVFWKRWIEAGQQRTRLYICLLPMLPIVVDHSRWLG